MIRTIVGVAGIGTTEIFSLGDIQGLGEQIKITKLIAVQDTAANDVSIIVSSGLNSITLDTDAAMATVTDIELSQNGLRDNRGVHSVSILSDTTASKYYMVLEDNIK